MSTRRGISWLTGPSVTESLAEAINWFILATTARRVRSDVSEALETPIHTTMRVDPQLAYIDPIRSIRQEAGTEIFAGRRRARGPVGTRNRPRSRRARYGLGSGDLRRAPAGAARRPVDELKVLADNGLLTHRLVYDDEPATVIAVGGTRSRGA